MTAERDERLSPAVLLIGAALLVLPFPVILHTFTPDAKGYDYATIVFPIEVALFGLLLVTAPTLVAALRRRSLGVAAVAWLTVSAILTVAWCAHPSGRGAIVLLHLWGAGALAAAIGNLDEPLHERVVFGTLGLVAVLETAWAFAELVNGGNLGLTQLGENPQPLYPFRSALAPSGSMIHIYILAGLALVAASALAWMAIRSERPLPVAVAAAFAVAPVGVTYSRAALLGLAGLGVCVLAAVRKPQQRGAAVMVAIALCVGAGVPALIWSSGWRERATQTTGASTAAGLTTERGTLDGEALHLLNANPILGVGPGRYVIALRSAYGVERNKTVGIFKPVHDLPLLAGAEGGYAALAAMAGLLAIVGWRALRAGPLSLGLYVAYLPYCLLDHFPYSFPQGVIITGVWLGVLDLQYRRRNLNQVPAAPA